MKKLAIIGASYLQEPLIERAKAMGIETHVFAWAANDVGEKKADFFYPISIVEKEKILEKCKEIGIDGICSIASDLAVIAVNYVATEMGLVGNSMDSTRNATNKYCMRRCFETNGDPSPKSILVQEIGDVDTVKINFPVIVKPIDRSGSRGITKVWSQEELMNAIEYAKSQGFAHSALVEEFAEGQEYSVECISWRGKHYFLAMTKKYTTDEPHFIETGHLEPAPVELQTLDKVKKIIFHALDGLGIMNGASHSEIKIASDGSVKIIEIGARMGGDFIGSDLVRLSTGIDFVRAVIQIALGEKPQLVREIEEHAAAIRYVLSAEDVQIHAKLKKEHPEYIVRENIPKNMKGNVTDSSTRFGYYLMWAESFEELEKYLP